MEEKAKKEIEELNKSLEQLRLKSPSNKTEIANKLFKIGDIYRYYLAKYDEALNFYEQSLEISRQTLPSNHPHIATTLNNIGSVYNDKGRYEEALCYYNQSLEINKQSLPPNHPFIATTLNNLGSVYYVQRKYSEALKHFIQSLEILKLTLPPNHPDIATTLNNIASVYKDQRKYDLSLRYFNESFEMRKQTLPSNHPDIAATLNNIGSVYIDEGKHEEALKHYNLSLELRRQSLPPNHPDILTTMNNIGVLYADQGRFEEALIFLKDERKKKECLKEILKKRNSKKIENPVNINEYVKKVENLRAPQNIYPISNRATLKVEVMEDEFINRIFLNRYKAMKFLGGGTFGRVYLVNDQMDSISEKAIKIMRKDETAENELNVITSVDHENIVRYYDHFELIKGVTKYLCIITEFCHKGDLSRRIEERKKFSEREIFTWTFQAVKGLKYLHSIGMIHRDIKPENILLSKDDVVKLGDLGVAKLTEATIHADTFTGTRPYMSPELFACENRRNKKSYSFNTDIWSLGCVLYEMMFFERTFPMGPGTNPTIPDLGDSLVFTPILKKMLLKNYEERIDSSKLYNELLKVNSFLDEI